MTVRKLLPSCLAMVIVWFFHTLDFGAALADGPAVKQITALAVRQDVRSRQITAHDPSTQLLWQRLGQQLDYLQRFCSPGTVERMAMTVAKLSETLPNDPTLASIRRLHCRANLYVYLDGSVLVDRLSRQSRQVVRIHDNILGTQVIGSGLANTQVNVHLVPSSDDIRLQFNIQSTTQSRTVGYNGPAIATTVGQTDVDARKQIAITRRGLLSSPTSTDGVTHSKIVDFEWQRMLGKRIAEREAAKRKPASDAESNRLVQRRVRTEVDQQIGDQAHVAVNRFVNRLTDSLETRHICFDRYRFRSTHRGIELAAVLAGPRQLSTPEPYPFPLPGDGGVIQVHDSLFNNQWEQRLGGRTFGEDDWAALLPVNARIGSALPSGDDHRTWTVSFERQRPVVVRFSPNAVTIGLRASRFQLGDRSYPAARIAAKYVLQPGTHRFQRGGRLAIDVVSGTQKTIGARQQVYRSLLRKRFDGMFPDSFSCSDWHLPPNAIDGLSIEATDVTFDHEWATIRIDVQPNDDVRPSDDPVADVISRLSH